MNVSLEQKRAKSIERLHQLGLDSKNFENGEVNVSYLFFQNVLIGKLDENLQILVKEFENEQNALVYHAILTPTTLGTMLSLLFIGDYEDDIAYEDACMQYELENIQKGLKNDYHIMSYVYNLDDKELSEFGYILVEHSGEGLIRTA